MARPFTRETLRRRVEAARGVIPCDLVLRNATYLDVFGCTWAEGDIAIIDGTIVATERGLEGARVIDCAGRHVVPGFVDAHVHIESSLLTPHDFERMVLPRGTTTAICDPHELANVLGARGIRYFLDAATNARADLRIMMSSCVPSTHHETNGGGAIESDVLAELGRHPAALGLAEVMNVPGVLGADPLVCDKLVAFANRPLDGHAPLVRGRDLSAYAAAGISSCHESSELEEAREKLQKGISVWIREGSVAKDLAALTPLLTLATSTSIGFCTDDRNPLDIEEAGHLDYLVRGAIAGGVAPEVAYRAASWSPARHYGLAGPAPTARKGAIAPGWDADLVLLDDRDTCAVRDVLRLGVPVGELEIATSSGADGTNTVQATAPEAHALEGPKGRVHVIGVRPGRILTDRHVLDHDAPGVSRLTVLERHGHGLPPANGYVTGFGVLDGAIASSVGHDCHNLIVTGSSTTDMRTALALLIERGGGFCVVRRGHVLAELPLPVGGLMTTASAREVADALRRLREASRSIGCELPEPFLQLAFLSLPVIPSLKLTDKGLVDVERFAIIDVRAA